MTTNALVWFSWFGIFVVLELLGYAKQVPWDPLSVFVWQLEVLAPWLAFIFYFGLATLAAHLATRWP